MHTVDKYIDVPMLQVPAFESIGDTARDNFWAFDNLVKTNQFDAKSMIALAAKISSQRCPVPSLLHELSDFYLARNSEGTLDIGRSRGEYCILKHLLSIDDMAFISPLRAFKLLKIAVEKIEGASWRKGLVQCRPDKFGVAVRFPKSEVVCQRLFYIFKSMNTNIENCSSYAATVVLSSILALHPLSDGNGRLSRIIFSYILSVVHKREIYLPLYDFSILSSGGFIISLRKVHYYNQWEDISNFLLNSIKIYSE